jgi:hypothetical protein
MMPEHTMMAPEHTRLTPRTMMSFFISAEVLQAQLLLSHRWDNII